MSRRRVGIVVQCPESMLYCVEYWTSREPFTNWSMSKQDQPDGKELEIKPQG